MCPRRHWLDWQTAMKQRQNRSTAIAAINKAGCLLVFPLDNRPEPASIWSALYPRSKMRWEWDAGADNKVAGLWILREELARSREVVYCKWYQNRATFFSKEVFVNMLAFFESPSGQLLLTAPSREALDSLLVDSPQSTKLLKENLSWQGRLMESHYNRALKPLWQQLFLVGYGEVEDSSFPSLNIGATETLFEELWLEAKSITAEQAEKRLEKKLGAQSLFWKFALKIKKAQQKLSED